MNAPSLQGLIDSVPPRSIPTYDGLSYKDFLNQHILPNTPCILSPKLTAQWPARHEWATRTPSEAGPSKPNLQALKRYAHQVVPVANTLQQEFSEFERTERPLGEVLDLWEAGEGQGLYVKDWHLLAEIELEGKWAGEIYTVPECLRDDWLNPPFRTSLLYKHVHAATSPEDTARSAAAANTSDFRFTYLGPAGTFTPLHRDVYKSYSWSANIVGRKIWWLFPPDRLEPLRTGVNGDFVFDVRSLKDEGGGIKILQEEGEIIFVPSGWYHQVVNVDFCISINHNFFASPTLPRIFTAMEEAITRVEISIEDIKPMINSRLGNGVNPKDIPLWEIEWVEEVQKLVTMDSGWGWQGFWETMRRNVLLSEDALQDQELLPPRGLRDKWVRKVIHRYKRRREYVVLGETRAVVDEIEGLLASP